MYYKDLPGEAIARLGGAGADGGHSGRIQPPQTAEAVEIERLHRHRDGVDRLRQCVGASRPLPGSTRFQRLRRVTVVKDEEGPRSVVPNRPLQEN